MKTIIKAASAPAPIGPYSQAVQVGAWIFTSGQIPLDIESGMVCATDIQGQTRKVLEHVRSILNAAGTDLVRVVKSTVYLKDMRDFAQMNEIYASFFPGDSAPARSCVEVARLPKDVLVEIEVIAVI